jgi:uncharacterized protein (DUF433 family)
VPNTQWAVSRPPNGIAYTKRVSLGLHAQACHYSLTALQLGIAIIDRILCHHLAFRQSLTSISYEGIITIEGGKHGGKPCIRGMHITVYDLLSYLAAAMTSAEVLAGFPYLTRRYSSLPD